LLFAPWETKRGPLEKGGQKGLEDNRRIPDSKREQQVDGERERERERERGKRSDIEKRTKRVLGKIQRAGEAEATGRQREYFFSSTRTEEMGGGGGVDEWGKRERVMHTQTHKQPRITGRRCRKRGRRGGGGEDRLGVTKDSRGAYCASRAILSAFSTTSETSPHMKKAASGM